MRHFCSKPLSVDAVLAEGRELSHPCQNFHKTMEILGFGQVAKRDLAIAREKQN